MKKMYLVPNNWNCTIEECPPGPFAFMAEGAEGQDVHLGFKSEYRTETGKVEAYNVAGEFFCGEGKVIPLVVKWEEEE